MVVFIAGASHTGKTCIAQKLMERYKYPYLSIDHLKMGLIRSGIASLTPYDDGLTSYLWPVVREIAKTAIENKQNLIIEGCYLPLDYKTYFDEAYLSDIKFYCLVMTKKYIVNNFSLIKSYADIIEKRTNDDLSLESLIEQNVQNLDGCLKHKCEYILIDGKYDVDIRL